jgi:hypothetical protein
MSIENPKNKNEVLEQKPVVAENAEKELTEEEELAEQGAREMKCAESFIQNEILKGDLTPEQKTYVADYIQKNLHKGDWRHYDGKDFALVGMKIENGVLILSFKIWIYDDMFEDTYTNIPMPVSE